MDKRIKAKWLAALRSRKFKQTHGQLREDEPIKGTSSYCCLGVLCEILKEDYSPGAGTPPLCVLEKAGLTQKQADTLADLNDSDKGDIQEVDVHFTSNISPKIVEYQGGFTFGKIAKFIEKYL